MAFISPAVKWICLLLTGATLRTIRFDKTIMSISHSIGAFRTTNIELHSIRIDPIKHLIYVFAWYPFVLRRNTRNPRVKHKVHGNPNRCAPIEINTTHVQNVTIFFQYCKHTTQTSPEQQAYFHTDAGEFFAISFIEDSYHQKLLPVKYTLCGSTSMIL